ncbi:hypothetical protein FE257_008976 [Aspergillus nanangensis]|uniref:Uncharacterized protein n=1 Tax=Aspergillus nanangensis TaxID=2582783 RepID=A0AAD4CWH2_ASPNN|nr:hypothetical protein FE257_008976 [Aspergillus nanangensis]
MEAWNKASRSPNQFAGGSDKLAILLLLQGSAGFYLHRDSPAQLASAAGYLRECLEIIENQAAPEDQRWVDFIRQSAVMPLSMFYLEKAMHTDEEPSGTSYEERLRNFTASAEAG